MTTFKSSENYHSYDDSYVIENPVAGVYVTKQRMRWKD
jgi:hypothetical protein